MQKLRTQSAVSQRIFARAGARLAVLSDAFVPVGALFANHANVFTASADEAEALCAIVIELCKNCVRRAIISKFSEKR